MLVSYYVKNKPFDDTWSNIIETFNEVCLYTLTILYLQFTDYVSSYSIRWYVGYVCIAIILLNFFVNIILLL
jgi:hypothetical protein